MLLGLRFNLRYIKFLYVLQKIKNKVNRGGKSAILPNWCYRQSITVLSTPPSSMKVSKNEIMKNFAPSNNFALTTILVRNFKDGAKYHAI